MRDALEEAEAGYAAILDNFMPGDSQIQLRPGYAPHMSGFDAPVESLMEYAVGGETRQLFAAAGTGIYDATTAGTVAAPVLTDLQNAQWQHTMYAAGGGSVLVCVNGADGVHTYNGTGWTQQNLTGVGEARFVSVASHKARLWFAGEDLKAWYLPPLAIAGTASYLDLGPVAKRGGAIKALSGWSVDAGNGADDYLVIVTSEGECIVYAGIDPNSDTSWSHVGTYQTDRPIGRRCLAKQGADLLILTTSGVVSVAALLNNESRKATISELIRSGLQRSALSNPTSEGWEMQYYPKRGWLIVNSPAGNDGAEQYVYNSLIKPPDGWCRLKGQDARCWGFLEGHIYFGGTSGIYKADIGNNDAGAAIEGRVQWAWNRMGVPNKKRFTLARVNMRSNLKPVLKLAMQTDYDASPATNVPVLSLPPAVAIWDATLWDSKGWADGINTYNQWVSVSGVGHVGGLNLAYASTEADFAIVSAEVTFETSGGVL